MTTTTNPTRTSSGLDLSAARELARGDQQLRRYLTRLVSEKGLSYTKVTAATKADRFLNQLHEAGYELSFRVHDGRCHIVGYVPTDVPECRTGEQKRAKFELPKRSKHRKIARPAARPMGYVVPTTAAKKAEKRARAVALCDHLDAATKNARPGHRAEVWVSIRTAAAWSVVDKAVYRQWLLRPLRRVRIVAINGLAIADLSDNEPEIAMGLSYLTARVEVGLGLPEECLVFVPCPELADPGDLAVAIAEIDRCGGTVAYLATPANYDAARRIVAEASVLAAEVA
jgi:hypothetical protein